jgi:hypothetical protein
MNKITAEKLLPLENLRRKLNFQPNGEHHLIGGPGQEKLPPEKPRLPDGMDL